MSEPPVLTHDWQSPNFPTWERVLSGRDFKSILEIGSFEGRSAIWFLDHFKDAHIVCVDTFDGGTELKELNVDFSGTKDRFIANMEPYNGRFMLYVGESSDVLRRPSFIKEEFDLILIDGSHAAANVMEDSILCWRLLQKGGVMIFDDYAWGTDRPPWDTPKPAIDAFLACYLDRYRLLEKGYQVLVEKL